MNMRNQQLFISFFKVLYRNPKILIGFLMIFSVIYSYEYFIAREKMTIYGVPESNDRSSFVRIFRNDGFMLGYSDIRANPLWVIYKLSNSDQVQKLKRVKNFSPDIRTLYLVNTQDYTNSGYDRGHLAPNYAISSLYGKNGQKSTFLMSNITPQNPNLNQHIWKKLEIMEFDTFRHQFKELWVLTGPVFDKNISFLKGSRRIQVPDAFYKIYLGKDDSKTLKSFAVLIPQNVKKNAKIEDYIESIDSIEEQTKIDFFPNLDLKIQEKIESQKNKIF